MSSTKKDAGNIIYDETWHVLSKVNRVIFLLLCLLGFLHFRILMESPSLFQQVLTFAIFLGQIFGISLAEYIRASLEFENQFLFPT